MYYLSWNKFLLKELQLVLAFSPQDQKIFPPGKKLHRVATRTFFLFLFSLCFHFPSRDVILGLVHDRVSLLLKVLSLKCIYIYIIIIINNRDVIFYYSDFSRDSKLHKHRISS